MGLTKQYLRYAASAVFGVIGSQKANIAFVTMRGGERGRFVAVAACEHVFIWDVRKAEKVLILKGNKHEVTYLCPSPDGIYVAVGYEDGAVRIFSLLNGESNVSFNGHKSAVTVIRYDTLGSRLVTGSRDTDVIVWDVINECGLYRLKGHKDAVTQALFLKDKNLLVTSSKDSFVKWWDLDTQHCFKTMLGHRSEVWGMALLNQESRLITGSADSELRAWDINYLQEGREAGEPKEKKGKSLLDDDDDEEEEEVVDESPEERILSCKKAGSLLREARDRVVSMTTDAKAKVLACHGSDTVLEVFSVLPEDEVERVMAKKLKRAKKKARDAQHAEDAPEPVVERKLANEIVRLTNIKASANIRWVDCLMCAGGELKVAMLLQNNTVETYSLKTSDKNPTGIKTSRLTLGGHRTDARTLAFSSDNIAVLSASGDTVKVWNRSTLQVIRTMACDYALCSLFVPGDRQIILGTKSGKIQIFDLASGTLLETVDAHNGALWSLCLSPDQRGIVTGGADKTVKFWEFELIKDEDAAQKRLTVKHVRTLQLDEDVLCVKYSPDQRLLAVSLLDCTVKVFYTDTLKFFLSLYGHKLPVLCLDISHDSALIATGSADRNVKIWGLDFGDCHRSMFAHDDSVMFLQFVPKTHLFFTAGKDKKIKQWDADKFEHIQTLEGHHREVWCLAISPNGDHIVSSSHDKSLRLWERTREPIILEEEREMEREAEFEEGMDKGDEPVVPGENKDAEAAPAAKKTIETVKAAERVMEALELYRSESRKMEEHQIACQSAGKHLPPPKANPILVAFGNVSPSRYVLDVIKKVRSSELEVSLLVLPFPYIPDLLSLFNCYVQDGLEVELVCRCLFFLLRIHFGQISSNQMLLTVIDELRINTISKVREIRDVLGFNSAGLQFLQREVESKEEIMFFADATGLLKEKRRKRKKRERAILTIA
ncbi:WD repeat-containing protein 3 [Oncorhynchus kisutch]|uniref:WD repeat-containing protein 3 n=1 Tax=Oncorhynchus kisutch TaxID=8019 RepID=UPI00099FAB3B|nr:WD repeat-containing protein 3 [Oncorhynchus kisutch]XP_031661781.1 WD repeat-containing protein 3 [Oncorhynchus kisutch]XP_031661782.1 WD repeat-containing protein 3 [Oncorhynchus kisutch]